MKTAILSLFALCISTFTSQAQTASLYFPLSDNASWVKHGYATGGSGWAERRATRTVVKHEQIPALAASFYCVVDRESVYTAPSSRVLAAWWLKPDASGNTICGAWGNSPILDSATVFSSSGVFFPNEMCFVGYTRTVDLGAGRHEFDSTESNSETVQVAAGTFSGCLKIHQIVDNLGIKEHEENEYYAPHVGSILNVRVYPLSETSRAELVSYILTSVNSQAQALPHCFQLSQNYPNPFNPTTRIAFDLPKDSRVSLIVYNVLGQVVARLVEGPLGPGAYSYNFAADRFSAGIYYYVLTADEFRATKKMVLLK